MAKSGYIRRKILELNGAELNHIDLSAVPGGAETFEKAAKFCYGINFEISVHNIAGLWCTAEYLQMTNDCCCTGNLAGRAEEFLVHVAFKTLSGSVIVLNSCESLLPFAEDVALFKRCVDVVAMKVFLLIHPSSFFNFNFTFYIFFYKSINYLLTYLYKN